MIKKSRSSNKGITMVETLVAFVVLTIIFVLIYKIVFFCAQMKMKTQDVDNVIAEFNQEIYKSSGPDAAKVEQKNYSVVAAQGPVFYLTLDTDKTDMAKNVNDTVTPYDDQSNAEYYKLPLYDVVATSYKSKNALIEQEQLLTPKVIRFRKK